MAKRSDPGNERLWAEQENEFFETLEKVGENTCIPVQKPDFDPEKSTVDEG